MTVAVSWDEDGVTFTIAHGTSSSYQIGLLDTYNLDGWRGEDCLNGMAEWLICHPVGATGKTLQTVWDIPLVDPGNTTRHTLTEHEEGALTYVLLDDADTCVGTWGQLTDYYITSTYACPVMTVE
jgi:hypothetical protein